MINGSNGYIIVRSDPNGCIIAVIVVYPIQIQIPWNTSVGVIKSFVNTVSTVQYKYKYLCVIVFHLINASLSTQANLTQLKFGHT